MKKLNITAAEYQHKVRQQAKARTIKFRKEQEKRGYKNLTVYLSEPFRVELKRLSDEKGFNRQTAMDYIFEVYQQFINDCVTSDAILDTEKTAESPVNVEPIKSSSPQELKFKSKTIHEKQTEIPAPMPGYLIDVDPNMPIEERHKIILRLTEDFPGRKNAQTRIDLLNAAGILLGGKPWEKTKQFADQLSIARRWAKKQTKKS